MAFQQQQVIIQLDTTAAGTGALRRWKCLLPGKWYILEAILMPDIAVAAHATNGTTIALQKGANEAALADLATHDSLTGGDGALTAGTAVDFTPAEGLNRVISDGDLVAIEKVDAASGQAFAGSVQMLLERRDLG